MEAGLRSRICQFPFFLAGRSFGVFLLSNEGTLCVQGYSGLKQCRAAAFSAPGGREHVSAACLAMLRFRWTWRRTKRMDPQGRRGESGQADTGPGNNGCPSSGPPSGSSPFVQGGMRGLCLPAARESVPNRGHPEAHSSGSADDPVFPKPPGRAACPNRRGSCSPPFFPV